jgi:hypothetical protein
MKHTVIGIDPGNSGGVCVMTLHDHIPPRVWRLQPAQFDLSFVKTTEDKQSELITALYDLDPDHTKVTIEFVTGIPFNPKTNIRQSVHANFRFGRFVGLTQGIFIGCGFEVQEISPAAWQKIVGVTPKSNQTKTEKKNGHKDVAKYLFGVDLTHWQTDAALIAYASCFTS